MPVSSGSGSTTRLVVVEGPTGSGKSTLVSRLHTSLGYPTKHHGVPPQSGGPAGISEWFAQSLDLPTVNGGLIFDRWVYSNHVYWEVLRNQFLVSRAPLEQKALAKFDRVCTIFIRADESDLLVRIRNRQKQTMPELTSLSSLARLVRSYDNVAARCGLPKIVLDASELNADEVFDQAVQFLKRR